MQEKLKDYNIFVDFGNGDKFIADGAVVDEMAKTITIHGSQGQLGWVRLNAFHPIKVATRPKPIKKVFPVKTKYLVYGRPSDGDPFELICKADVQPKLEEWLGYKLDKKAKANQVKCVICTNHGYIQPELILTVNGWAKWDSEVRRFVYPEGDGISKRK